MPIVKKIIFITQIDNIHQNNAKVSLYAFKNYFLKLEEIKLKFAQNGNFYNNDEKKYFCRLFSLFTTNAQNDVELCLNQQLSSK